MEEQLDSLIELMDAPQQDVRQQVSRILLGFTMPTGEYFSMIKRRATVLIPKLLRQSCEPAEFSHEAISALVNLTSDRNIVAMTESGMDKWLKHFVECLADPLYPNAETITMLLSNMTKHAPIATALLTLKVKPMSKPEISPSERAIDQLIALFVKGIGRTFNKTTDYHFLSHVFGNMTVAPAGRKYFVSETEMDDGRAPISALVVFTDHESEIRRTGVISAIKNCAFQRSAHRLLLDVDRVNILPYVMLPLMAGSDEFDDEDTDGMPDECQLLPEDKQRERDPSLRELLLETILLLTSTRWGREYMRKYKVYPVIREMHKIEPKEDVKEVAERIVNMLERDESRSTSNDYSDEEDDSADEDDDDHAITEA
ncbi:DUF383-domain-containing protein [Ramicandelaber brevisporus]|nr:DUF383-domain-containing protein [Ramicandelaber brevisporus]